MPASAPDATLPDSGSKPVSACIHCGTQFRPTPTRPDYCCAGCQFVHGLILKNGLAKFYDLQDGGLLPVKSLVFQKRDYAWLAELVKTAEAAVPSSAVLDLDLQGISCVGCVWLIEKLFLRKPGSLAIEINTSLAGRRSGRRRVRAGTAKLRLSGWAARQDRHAGKRHARQASWALRGFCAERDALYHAGLFWNGKDL